ncbi:dihydrodipicolinate synthase family protein [Burkholderia ubonensis]|uniref:Dihydrodipicolinate synthase family protein n=1 Tax=Burkholderia ubonensis TaxID=101571 RepID=A0ABD4E327_9BURK|nr:dihydrodipicolinate synthase family protein [Burkholderia ubonensis]AJX12483.1 dihydrodipicolinate synthetase family protein [Burkholderia ubonensis MSMB22]KVD01077.1 dihydrodipicolinate synthase family protein [Burkholderia ubonensis]KVD38745.1 dihydrodipicolinate synthase family protein [Burkholderia ubonensis]KVD59478.1 dihydrodipicolinate synthase family protein [Burkholderia ubonensis]KVD67893.1 dihydrodipicolinate synthase family protein [Burkholderia ubonensis]
MSILLQGIIAYPVTPFSADGDVDLKALDALIERLVADGVHGIAPLGSTGESAYLSDAEWEAVADTSIRAVRKRVPTVVGISDLTTAGAVRRARFAEQAGADAVMVLPVSYWKLSNDEIVGHYRAIGDAIGIPVMLYNNPATSGVDMSPELIATICRTVDNVTMVKESTGDIMRMHRLAQLSDGAIPFYNGSNPMALAALAAGAAGWCTAAPNLNARLPLALVEAVRAGDLARAREVFHAQLPLLQFIVSGGLPVTVKAGLRLRGFDAGEPRKPLLPLGEDRTRDLARLLAALPVCEPA